MATKTKSETMNGADMLRQDHRKVLELFKKYEELGDGALKTKKKLSEQIFQELEVHTKLEEDIFYPAAKDAGEDELEEVVTEGYEEHHVADVLIAEIRALEPDDERFDAKMKVLSENIEHHIEEEEQELLPEAEKALGEQMDSITQQMLDLRKQLQSQEKQAEEQPELQAA